MRCGGGLACKDAADEGRGVAHRRPAYQQRIEDEISEPETDVVTLVHEPWDGLSTLRGRGGVGWGGGGLGGGDGGWGRVGGGGVGVG